jgi:hypothetical protein
MGLFKKIVILIFILSFSLSYSQDSDKKLSLGFTAGFNYNSNGEYVTTGTLTEIAKQFDSEKKTGYHAGLYIQYNMTGMYLRPEVLYTKTKSTYGSSDFDQTKIEVPILVGFDIIKPVSIFVGPSIQYVLENEMENIDVNNIDVESDLGINFQAGIAIQLHKQIRIDIRYEKGISNNILTIKNDSNSVIGELNTKPEQIILGFSLSL